MSLFSRAAGRKGPGIPGLFAVLLLLLAAGCFAPRSGDALRGAETRAPLRVGSVADYPPLAFVRDGEWCGAEADLARALAERLDRSLEWKIYPADGLESALRRGEIDIVMAGYAVTPERRATLDFARPYLSAGLGALARASRASRYPTAADVHAADVPVGAVRGTRAETYARRYLSRATVLCFDAPGDAEAALRDGRIELYLDETPRLWDIARRDPSRLGMASAQMDRADLAWAFLPSAPTLREAANRALDTWIRDGTLDLVLRPWLPVAR